MVAPDKRSVLLVDDHPVTRKGTAALINRETDLYVCAEADSAPAALQLIRKFQPQLVIVDISLRNGNGLELIKSARPFLPNALWLVMTMHEESLYAERALRAGARGYLTKDRASEEIIVAARKILNGELYLSEALREVMLDRFVNKQPASLSSSPVSLLSDREMEVFRLMGNGFRTREIAATLFVSTKTVDSYREHIKAKLHLKTGAEVVRHAIQWAKSGGEL